VPDLGDIHSLSDFQTKAPEYLERWQADGRPHILTDGAGKAALVVQDAAAYEKLLKEMDRLEAVAGVKRGLDEHAAGKGRPAKDAFEDIRKKHGIPRGE